MSRKLAQVVSCLVITTMILMLGTTTTVRAQQIRTSNSLPPQKSLLIVNGRLMQSDSLEVVRGQPIIWIRDLEKLGIATVTVGQEGKVMLKRGDIVLTFTSEPDVAMINSLAVKLPVNTMERDGKLMVPLSFVTKALGLDFDYSVRPVVTVGNVVSTQRTTKAVAAGGGIEGIVLYNNKPVPGVKVRAIDLEYHRIPGAMAITNREGKYAITGLPLGDYRAYVYIGDNPGFFNRESEPVTVKQDVMVKTLPIELGRVVSPAQPKSGEIVKPRAGRIKIAWTPIEGAVSYKLEIRELGVDKPALEISSMKSNAELPAESLSTGVVYEAHVTAFDSKGNILGGTPDTGQPPWTFSVQN